jgi:hypothetical protein
MIEEESHPSSPDGDTVLVICRGSPIPRMNDPGSAKCRGAVMLVVPWSDVSLRYGV